MNRPEFKGIMYLQSTVCRVMKDKVNNKRVAYLHLTDGWIQTTLTRDQYHLIIKQATAHPRYAVGVEQYANPTGDINIDGHPTENFELESTVFHHIFIKPQHLEEVFEDYAGDRHIHFLTKTNNKENETKLKVTV